MSLQVYAVARSWRFSAKRIRASQFTEPSAKGVDDGVNGGQNEVGWLSAEFDRNVAADERVRRQAGVGSLRLLSVFIFAAIAFGLQLAAFAQGSRESFASDRALPDAPGYEAAPQASSASVSGTVLDTNGDVIQGATVSLVDAAGAAVRTTTSGDNGQFNFPGLSPGTFRLIVTGQGMGRFDSGEFALSADEVHTVSHVLLPVSSTATEVRVTGDKEEIAEEQVQIAIEQRVLGILPNFYSTYDWNAPPLGSKQKFELAFRAVRDPMAFAGAGLLSGIEQANGTYRGYGGGIGGYSKRFGAAYADDVAGRMLSSAVFPALFHQDPRYFYKGTGSKKSRLFYAMSAAVITRSDNKNLQPNYSHLLGGLAAGGLSNLYYPAENRGVSLTLVNWAIGLAGHAGNNVLREFVLKGVTSKKGGGTDGSPLR